MSDALRSSDAQLMLPAPSGQRGRLRFWAGFSFKQPPEVARWMWGQVSTPRWAKRVRGPMMLDNGAFPAFRDGVDLPGAAQLSAMLDFASFAPEQVIACDIVADGSASWMRTLWSLRTLELAFPRSRILLPVQEGMELAPVLDVAARIGGGVFVGGATTEWKIATCHKVRRRSDCYLHVGRLTTPETLWPVLGVVDSFDTTTFSRSQHSNVEKRRRMWHAIEPMLEPPPWRHAEHLKEKL